MNFNAALAALWSVLDADDSLQALLVNASIYRFDGKRDQPIILEPAWCPVLSVAPENDGTQWRPARRRRGSDLAERLALRIEGATKGPNVSSILALSTAVQSAIETDMVGARGKLAAAGVDEIEHSTLQLEPGPDERGAVLLWIFRVTATLKFRVS